jgi:hypothetical protein
LDFSSLTYEFLVSLIDGKVPQRGGHGAHHPVHFHPQQLHLKKESPAQGSML